MELNFHLVFVILLLNVILCSIQFFIQQWELSQNKISKRGSIIASTNQKFNHWQDSHCQTWGDIIGIGLVFSGFAHLAYYSKLTTFDWIIFILLAIFGAYYWYRVGTGPGYKLNWGFPKTGKISLGGIIHLPYFGIGFATTIICIVKLVTNQLQDETLYIIVVGWLIYITAVVVDTLLGHKDSIETFSSPPIIKLIETGRLRGTLFTFLFTISGFLMYGESKVNWLVAILTAISCSLLHMSIMTFNDWIDRSHDLKKGKRLAFDYPKAFFGYWIKLTILTLGFIGILMTFDFYVGLLCLGVLVLGITYSYLENIIVLNNLIVATCGASPVLCGSVYFRTNDQIIWTWYGVFFTLVLGREIVKDIEDFEIDRGYKNTLSVMFGIKQAKQISLLVTGLSGFFIFLIKKVHETLILLGVILYKIVKWDPTSNPRKLVLLFDTLLGILVILLMVPLKYGDREIAMIDFWSIEHFLLGVVLYPVLKRIFSNYDVKKLLILFLAFAYTWELVEYLLELGVLGEGVSDWKKGYEHWSNRLIGDPLLVFFGGYISSKKQQLWKWLVIPWVIWGLVNYFAPTSMYIQEKVLNFF